MLTKCNGTFKYDLPKFSIKYATSRRQQMSVLMSEWAGFFFIQTADSFRNESIGCPYEWATESIDSLDSFKHVDSFSNQTECSETQQFCCDIDRNYFRRKPHLAQHKYMISRRLHWMPFKLESFSREMTCILTTVISTVSVRVDVMSLPALIILIQFVCSSEKPIVCLEQKLSFSVLCPIKRGISLSLSLSPMTH